MMEPVTETVTQPVTGAATIDRGAVLHPAQNFDRLKAEMIAAVQRLAGAGWTDFNAHDPGVTILEQLCYALTDLGYRADFPVADLLAGPDGTIATGRFGPHPAWRILPSPPVTPADFRRLLLDRVRGLGNVWVIPRAVGTGVADGLYDIRVQPAAALPGMHRGGRREHARLVARVRRMMLHHRPLGEDIGSIVALAPVRTIVCATLHLVRGTVAEEVVAQALYRIGRLLAPEPRRHDLPADADAVAVFDGPEMLSGLIADGELTDKPATIAVDMLGDAIADIDGVTGVADVRLWVEGKGVCATWAIDADAYSSLDAGLDTDTLPIGAMIDGRRCPVDARAVARRLEQLWAAHRQRHGLKAAYRRVFAMPTGRARDLTAFAPIAGQFPTVYGLGDGHAAPQGGAATQLAGYLAIFEMLMVDALDRLADVGGLLRGEPVGTVPTGSETLRGRIAALDHLGLPDTPADDAVFARMRMGPAQHERLIDFLLALYGEAADDVPVPPDLAADAAGRYRIAVKHALLGHVGALGRRRGRGFDYGSREGARRMAGIELRTRILLGDHDPRDVRHRQRIAFVEHVLLRPRTPERTAREDGRYRYGLGVSVVLHARRTGDAGYRRAIVAMIRESLPAHLVAHVHVVDRPRWRRFQRLHRMWRVSLRAGESVATDWLSVALRDLLDAWVGEP